MLLINSKLIIRLLRIIIGLWFFIILAAGCSNAQEDPYKARREKMVRDQIWRRGVKDTAVLRAMRTVERHLYVPDQYVNSAYEDRPLPIGYGQTISQPYIVAYMTQVIEPKPGYKVLEVGTGSGYQAAVLAEIVKHVYTIEIICELATSAKERLGNLGYNNITVKCGDGYNGWAEFAPFDAIIVTAGAEDIPQPLIDQLKDGGLMVLPVGDPYMVQSLKLVKKDGGKTITQDLMLVRFVPLIREE
jgi:protein-L-isoaspartate(D-aspartate) O-methyltransferase